MAQPAKPVVSCPTSPSRSAAASLRARASIPPTRKLVKTKSAPSTLSVTESQASTATPSAIRSARGAIRPSRSRSVS